MYGSRGGVERIFLDESGAFEGLEAEHRGAIVGGFVTTASPTDCVAALHRLVTALTREPQLAAGPPGWLAEPSGLHVRELPVEIDKGVFQSVCLKHLRDLPGFLLVGIRHYRDADVSVAGDAWGAFRFLRMWQTAVRNLVRYRPDRGEDEVAVHTAQRTVPESRFDAAVLPALRPCFARAHLGPTEPGLRIMSQAQMDRTLVGVADAPTGAPFPRTLREAVAGSTLHRVTWARIAAEPALAGLVLADVACDLVRLAFTAPPGVEDPLALCPKFLIAYDPTWQEYELACETVATSPSALARIVERVVGPIPEAAPQRLLHVALQNLVRSVVNSAQPGTALREALLEIARAELGRKEGRFPRCEWLFSPTGLPPVGSPGATNLDEWILRTEYRNHTGHDPRDLHALLGSISTLLDSEMEALFTKGEALAHLAVSLQDAFDYDEAESVVRDYVDRASTVLAALPVPQRHAPWTSLGRVLSNLAQTLSYRQNPDDIDRARDLFMQARPHLARPIDLSQWACHAGNFAVVAHDLELLKQCLVTLDLPTDVQRLTTHMCGLQLTRGQAASRLFAFSMVTRAAVLWEEDFGQDLRNSLEGECGHLLGRVRRAGSHPVEMYARHLLELTNDPQVEQDAFKLALDGFGNQHPSLVADTVNAGTLAAYAAKLFRTQRPELARQVGATIVTTFLRAFKQNPWVSCSAYCEETQQGWFFEALQALNANVTDETVSGFLERFRYEWR